MASSTTMVAASPQPQKSKQDNEDASSSAKKKRRPVIYNPRWKGYSCILITSLINLGSMSNIGIDSGFDGIKLLALSFGILTFVFALGVLVLDRTQLLVEKVNYTQARDGKIEGGALLFVCLWWSAGVGYITQVNGIAYKANNVYFSSWLALASCVYTLDQWSTEKDILSLDELTGVSATLRSWYILFLGSLVLTGSSLQMILEIIDFEGRDDAVMVFCFASVSTGISFFWICTHYKFLECLKQGGWQELLGCVVVIVLWIIGTATATREGGIGANTVGNNCAGEVFEPTDERIREALRNCTLLINMVLNNVTSAQNLTTFDIECEANVPRISIPGSNLYFSVWICLLSSLNIAFRWKAQQALQFAQAQNSRINGPVKERLGGVDSDDDDDDHDEEEEDGDLDDFEESNGF